MVHDRSIVARVLERSPEMVGVAPKVDGRYNTQ